MIGVIDYGAGNIQSVRNAFSRLGAETSVVKNARELARASAVVLPGVGSFGFLMKSLRKNGMELPLLDALKSKPFLGICLGLQVLFEESAESPGVRGLCVFKGSVRKFTKGKVPQVGWNKVCWKKPVCIDGYAYFVNSFFAEPLDSRVVAAETEYGCVFPSAISKGNITATQFHPEKSGFYGLDFLSRWLACLPKE